MDELNKILSGIEGVSLEERGSFIQENIEAGILPRNWTWDSVNRLYLNKQYVDEFGIEDFYNNTDVEARDTKFRKHVINNAVNTKYANDPNLGKILQMTEDGQLNLLNNNKYYDTEHLNSIVEDAKNTPVVTGYLPGDIPVYAYEDKSEERKAKLLSHNEEQLQAEYDKDLQRKKASLQPEIERMKNYLEEALSSGQITMAEINSHFEEITKNTLFGELKNSTIFKDWGDANTIEEYATFLALHNNLSTETAWQTIRADMQNWTADNMPTSDWADVLTLNMPWVLKGYKDKNPTKLRNAKRDVLTTAVATVGEFPVVLEGLVKSMYQDDGAAKDNWLNGLDADGNPLPNWRNPKYYQGMKQYNTYDAEMIDRLQQNGGMSPYVNVTQAGEELDFWNLTNITNSLTQAVGQALPYIALGVASGGLSSAASTAGSLFGKVAWGAASWGAKSLELVAPALAMSHAEGYEAYQNTLLELQQQIDARVDADVKSTMEELYNSEEGQKSIQNIMNTLKTQAEEQGKYYTDEEYLKEIATQEYLKGIEPSLRMSIQQEYEFREKEAKEEAARTTYNTVFGIHALKNVVFENALNRVFMSKGARQLYTDNALFKFKPKEYIDEAGNKVSKELTKTQKIANVVLEGAGQFTEELSDAWVNSLGENVGLNEFNDYVTKTYNPDDYVETTDNFFSHFARGLNDLPEDMFTREALFEGWAGLIGAFNVGVNPNSFISKTPFGYDEYGNKLSFGESLNNIISNPLLNAYYEYNPQERAAKARIEATKDALKRYSPTLDKVSALMTSLGNTDNESQQGTMMSTLDASFDELVQTAMIIDDLGEDELLSLNKKYQNADALAQSIIDGTINEEQKAELLDSYLHRSDNKSISTQSEEEAWNQITENAKKFSETRQYIHQRKKELSKDKKTKNLSEDSRRAIIYLELQNKNMQSRIDSMNSELDLINTTNSNIVGTYGSKKGIEQKRNELSSKIQSTVKKIEDTQKEIQKLERDFKKASTREQKQEIQDKLDTHNSTLKSLWEFKQDLDIEQKQVERASKYFEENEYSEPLSSNEILSLNPQQRAFILNPDNLHLYSPEQQQIIRQTLINLKKKDTDAEIKINDIAELQSRLEDNDKAYSRIIDNPDALEKYVNDKRMSRYSETINSFIQSSVKYLESQLEKATDEEAKTIIKGYNVPIVKEYIRQHPEKEALLSPILPLVKMHQDFRPIMEKLYGRNKSKRGALSRVIVPALFSANSVEEAMSNLEDLLDKPGDPLLKVEIEKYIKEAEEIGYQRDATKVQSREDKKKREEELNRKREEETKKKEEADKKAEESIKEAETSQDNITTTLGDDIDIGESSETVEESVEEVASEPIIEQYDADEANTPTVEEEIAKDKDAVVIPVTKDTDRTHEEESFTPTTLVGNLMYRYDGKKLKEDGTAERRTGEEENDNMSKFFRWLDAFYPEYQDVIDNELGRILEANPKIQLMMVNPNGEATNDKDVQGFVFNVVEYTDKVAKIHKSDKGVITSNGKRYLIIGVSGFGGNRDAQKTFQPIQYDMKVKRYNFLKNNPTERFYVDSDYHTEALNISRGILVRSMDGEDFQYRTIGELLGDSKRNPKRLAIEDLKWGIMTDTGMYTIGVSERNRVISPHLHSNIGNVFLLVQSGNGDYLPAYVKPVNLTELRNGKLKDKIDSLINDLSSTNFNDRNKAREELRRLVYLDSDNNINIGSEKSNTISIKKNGVVVKTFNLDDSSFNRMELVEAVNDLNPRINLTKDVLSSSETLQQYDKAGAIIIDIAKLGTANVSYSVYSMDKQGNPIKLIEPTNESSYQTRDSEYVRKQHHSVQHLGKVYRERNGEFYHELSNEKITDPILLEQLRALQAIRSNNLAPVHEQGGFEYYLINQDSDNPIAYKIAKGTNVVTKADKEQTQNLIKRITDENKKEAAELELQRIESQKITTESTEDIESTETIESTEKAGEQQEYSTPSRDINSTDDSLIISSEIRTSYNLSDILNTDYGSTLDDILEEKIESGAWEDVPDDISKLSLYLQKKGIQVIGITDVNSWLEMIRECK